MNKKKVQDLLEEALAENQSLYLIELSFLPGNKIQVVVDGDEGISLSECIRINKSIESSFDREEEDFALEVTSPDIAEPLKVKRQYLKNLNRIITVKLNDKKIEGTLIEVNKEDIVLSWKAREPKPVGKGKVTVDKTEKIAYQDIIEAKVKIIF
ncbi:Ribosome maturation factor RimP [Polaribacter huanghezhanensis]|uniref:ribosome assembly cofactor RimP n=1 Tax=Polaribacter huanghezhanensis TaxID=1354726 RepID=UPI0026470271|nr:ribosome assembly cofactor RimP [Polaribacter huanghezhanensis]WKD85732.1 Ribosome maturation factor RimP [Polaribacter huanghezhanensis]